MYKVPKSSISVFNVNNKSDIFSIRSPTIPLEPPPDPNKALLFNTKANNDDEIIDALNYKLNLDIETLLRNADNTRRAIVDRKKGSKRPPRPLNAWILYRRDKSASKEFQGLKLKSAQISKKISEMWNEEPQETKVLFEALSRMAEKIHRKKYGENYRYRPKRPKNIRKKGEKEINLDLKQSSSPRKVKKLSSELTSDVEQKSLPTPSTSPTTPSSEFEEILPELPVNTEQQFLSNPSTSLPSTSSSLELEESFINSLHKDCFLTMDIEQMFQIPAITTLSPSEFEEELQKSVALLVTPPSSPTSTESTESTEPLPGLIINAEQQYSTSSVFEQLLPFPMTSNFIISSPFEPLAMNVNAEQQFFSTSMTSICHSPLTLSPLEVFPPLLNTTPPSSEFDESSLESIMNAEREFFNFEEEEKESSEFTMNVEEFIHAEEFLPTPVVPSSLDLFELEILSKNLSPIPYMNDDTLSLDSFTPILNLSDLLCPDTTKSESLDEVEPKIVTNSQFSEELLTMTETCFSYYANSELPFPIESRNK